MTDAQNWNQDIHAFLEQKRIVVAGVSRSKNEAANMIYRKLRDTGYEVFAVNPNAQSVEGVTSYPKLAAIPGGIDAVVIATPPKATLEIVHECVDLDIRHVWMHRSFGQGSYSDEAANLARESGIHVIPGGCPMMFCGPVDMGHRCMRWFLRLTGGLPKAA
ncbi:MAG: CoA-binding protein [bacterium]|nr:CoA-binding protein [bacterium]